MSDQIHKYVSSCLQYQEDKVLSAFANAIRNEYKDSVTAIIFYGSCMRTREYKDAMLDFYVVVDRYKTAYSSLWYRLANAVLPPNVFYLQVEIDSEVYRSKYAVISQSALLKEVSKKAFHPYFWARFTQPFTYIYVRDTKVEIWIADVQSTAIKTFFRNVACTLDCEYDSKQFWVQGFQLTYESELRTESKDRAGSIYQDNAKYYDEVFNFFASKDIPSKNKQFKCKFNWKLRIALGKVLSVIRLAKATTTFTNGVDYIAWKIERHTGEKVEVTNRLRKYPWIFSWPILCKLIRSKSVR